MDTHVGSVRCDGRGWRSLSACCSWRFALASRDGAHSAKALKIPIAQAVLASARFHRIPETGPSTADVATARRCRLRAGAWCDVLSGVFDLASFAVLSGLAVLLGTYLFATGREAESDDAER